MKSSDYIAVETVDMLKDTLSKFFNVDSLLNHLTGYLETRVELYKIEVKEDLAKGLAKAISYLIIAFMLSLFIIFISIAVALLLGTRYGNLAGFSAVGSVYLLTGLVLWFSREKMISRFENRLATMARKKKTNL